MRNRNIPKNIQIRVLKELEHFQLRQQQDGQRGDTILQQLSLNIRNQVKKEYYGKILQKYKLLTLNFSAQFIEQLSLKLKEIFLSPDEVVLQQGDHLNKVFCLVNGELIVYQENNNNKSDHIAIGKIKKGEFSDQRALFFEYNIEYGLKSAGISQLVYFTNEDFISTLKLFPQEYVSDRICLIGFKQIYFINIIKKEKYCMIKDNMIFQEKFIDLKCYCCGQYGHQTHRCPMVHYVADSQSVKIRQNKPSSILKRYSCKRSQMSFNSLKSRHKISMVVKEFRIKTIQQFISYYQPLIPLNVSDETFLSKVPEIFMDNGEVFINLDELVDEEEEFNSQMPSDTSPLNRNQQLIESLSPLTYNGIHSLFGQNGQHQNTQRQDSLNQTPNIYQQFTVYQVPIMPFNGEKEKPQSILDTNENTTPKGALKKQIQNSQQYLEGYQKIPSNGLIQEQLPHISFTNTVNQIMNSQNQIVSQPAIQNNQMQPQTPNQNSSATSIQAKIISTPLFLGEEPTSAGGQYKYQLFSSNNDVSSSHGSQIAAIRNSNNNNTGNYNNNNSFTNQADSNNTNKSMNEQNQSIKARKANGMNLFTNHQIGQQNFYNNVSNIQSPKLKSIMNSNNTNFSSIQNNSQTAAFYESPNQKPLAQLLSISNDLHAQPPSINKQQQQMLYITQQSGGSASECKSPLKVREEKKKSTLNTRKQSVKILNHIDQQKSLFSNYVNQQNGSLHYNLQQLQLLQQQQNLQYLNSNTNEIYLNKNLFDHLICEFPYSQFDCLKSFKYYFTHGNIESVCINHFKYLLNLVESRKYFKNQFKRKLIKQYQQQITDSSNEQSRKYSRQGAFDVGGNITLKKNSIFYKNKIYNTLSKKINGFNEIYEAKNISSLVD